MLKETIQYTNFDGQNVTGTLHFNITKSDLLDRLDLMDDVEAVRDAIQGEERELSRAEIKLVLDVVKKIMKLAYGERSEDGKYFRKTEQIWEDFTSTAVYDAFIMSLFEKPEKAADFIVAAMPNDLVAQVRAEQGVEDTPDISEHAEPGTNEPEAEKKFEDYSREQLLNMPQSQFEKLIPKSVIEMSQQQLQVAMQRKNAADASGK
jgi:hypothetical protein